MLTLPSFKTLQKDILTSDQGVYAGIVLRACGQTCVYIGSSYGKGGIKWRIIKNHLSQSYRNREPSKCLYIVMDELGATTFFICLARYPRRVSVAQILLTEAVCCSIFGSLNLEQYRSLRLKELPQVDWDCGLNRSDPLQIWRSGDETIGNDSSSNRRLRRLENCLKSGPVYVHYHYKGPSTAGSYEFWIFSETFIIPKDVAECWGLQNGSMVNVQWQISDDTHPHAFAPMAKPTDDGRRVGIRVFKTIRQIPYEHWIVRNKPKAVPLANTLYDFLTGQIVGKDYKWNDSRKYIFQESKYWQNKNDKGIDDAAADEVQRRVRTGLPYYNNFIWGDRTRKLETKPAGMVSRDMKLSDSTLTQEGMNERKAPETVLVDLPGIKGKPIAANDRGPPAIEGKCCRKLHILRASSISKHSVLLALEEELIANSISEDGDDEATDNNNNNNTDEEETLVSIEYQEWMEEFYIKWMLPHHQDL